MFKHTFIFTPGIWVGEGRIIINMIGEMPTFTTRWTMQPPDFAGKIMGYQKVMIQGLTEGHTNQLTFYNFQARTFTAEMENQNTGRIVGVGIYNNKMIGWEFRNKEVNFEGYETYNLQPDGSYKMKGEYVTSDQFRTQIEAHIRFQPFEVSSADEESKGSEGEP
jgi:hypothetical protein